MNSRRREEVKAGIAQHLEFLEIAALTAGEFRLMMLLRTAADEARSLVDAAPAGRHRPHRRRAGDTAAASA